MNWAVIWRCLRTLHCVAPQIADAEGVLTHFRIIMRHAPARAQDPPYDTVWQPLQGLLVSSASAVAFLQGLSPFFSLESPHTVLSRWQDERPWPSVCGSSAA